MQKYYTCVCVLWNCHLLHAAGLLERRWQQSPSAPDGESRCRACRAPELGNVSNQTAGGAITYQIVKTIPPFSPPSLPVSAWDDRLRQGARRPFAINSN